MGNFKICEDRRMNEDVMKLLTSLKDPSVLPSKTTLTFEGKIVSRLFSGKDALETVKPSPNIYKNEKLSLHNELEMLLQEEESSMQAGASDFM